MAVGIGAEKSIGKRGRRPVLPGITRSPKLKLYIGNKEISGELAAGATGTASISQGITFDELFGTASLEFKLELTRYGLLNLLGPVISEAVAEVPKLDAVVRATSGHLMGDTGLRGASDLVVESGVCFKTTEFTGKCGLEATYDLTVSDFNFSVYVGGEGSATFHYPPAEFEKLEFRAFAGLEAEIWVFYREPRVRVFRVHLSERGWTPRGIIGGENTALRIPLSTEELRFRPRDRSYVKNGPERFLAGNALKGSNDSAIHRGTLDEFRAIGRHSEPGPALQMVQVDLPLAENVFPAPTRRWRAAARN